MVGLLRNFFFFFFFFFPFFRSVAQAAHVIYCKFNANFVHLNDVV